MNRSSEAITRWQIAKNILFDYLSHSTVHSVSYITETGRSWLERVWWILVFCISLLCCVQLTLDAWHINPIIISFAEKPTPVWQIPFPAVTICPKLHARAKHINLTDIMTRVYSGQMVWDDLTEREKTHLIAINNYCLSRVIFSDLENMTNCNDCLNTVRQVALPPNEFLVECKFHDRVINCSESFKELVILSELCYRFNGFEIYRNKEEEGGTTENWSIDDGYTGVTGSNTYPYRALGAGSHNGLSLLMKFKRQDIAYHCNGMNVLWLEYRMPHEYPPTQTSFFNVPMGELLTVVLKPKMTTCGRELHGYPVTVRKCYFSNEYRLKYFLKYTKAHCELECEIDRILEQCGCFPNLIVDRGCVDICGPYQMPCMAHHMVYLKQQNYVSCNCLPECSSIAFESEITTSSFNVTTLEDYHADYVYSRLNIYFKADNFMSVRRSELYGTAGLLANCGGLLGLCLGVSVLSFFEAIYFCTVRFWVKLWRREISNQDHSERPIRTEGQVVSLLRHLVEDYSSKTTIQGISYVADVGLSVAERLWWASLVFLSTITCGSLILSAFKQYDQSPVIVSYANEDTSVSDIPFPAVTVCPLLVSADMFPVYYYLKVLNHSLYELDAHSIDSMTASAQVCDPDVFSDIDPEGRTNCENCTRLLRTMIAGVWYVFSGCYHLFPNETCADLYNEVITEDGVCFTYNQIEVYRDEKSTAKLVNDWTLEGGYKNSSGFLYGYPRAGTKFALVSTFQVHRQMIDGICMGSVQGFKVYLHLPNEVPQMSKHFNLVPYKRIVNIKVIPNMITTAKELMREISVEKRQCFFSDERYLRFFKSYTQNNCDVECVANLTIKNCGCQRMFMPKIPGVKLCGISDIRCYQFVIQQLIEQNINGSHVSVCNCLPSCTSISYDTEINQVYLPDDVINYGRGPDYSQTYIIAEFSVSFKDYKFVAMKRSQLYGQTELLANCGGLLGLFLGFSVVSILELVYFCTIRLFCNVIKLRI